MSELGDQIRIAREKANLTQDELAIRVSKSRVTINNYENGKGNPEFEVIVAIADVLGGEGFRVRGCRIGREDKLQPMGLMVEADQLRLNFDQDYTFLATLTIRPSRESVLITAREVEPKRA